MLARHEFVASFNISWAAKRQHFEIKRAKTGKEWVAMGTEHFIVLGVFPVELLA